MGACALFDIWEKNVNTTPQSNLPDLDEVGSGYARAIHEHERRQGSSLNYVKLAFFHLLTKPSRIPTFI